MKNQETIKKMLFKRKDELINEYKDLENELNTNRINKEVFEEKKYRIERELVEIMDQITQMRFVG